MVGGDRLTGAAALPIVGRMFIVLGIVGLIVSGVLAIVEMYGPAPLRRRAGSSPPNTIPSSSSRQPTAS